MTARGLPRGRSRRRGDALSTSQPSRATDLLRRLRIRHRLFRNVDGSFRLGVLLGLLFWGSFVVDWTLEVPWFVRFGHLVVGAGIVMVALRYFLGGVARPLPDEKLVVEVEAAGGFGESVLTAVQLSAGNPRAALYSPALLERTIAAAEEQLVGVRARDLLSRRNLHRSMGLCALIFLSILSLAGARPDLAETYVRRNILLSEVQWPREHLYTIAEPNETELVLAMGDPLTVRAIRERGGDTRVTIETEYDNGEDDQFQMERKGDGEYRKLFRNVSRDFGFRVSAGDFTSVEYSVKVRNRPRVEEIELAFDYPDYTGLPDQPEWSRELGGHVRVPVGTVVRYRVWTSIPVREALFRRVWREGVEEKRNEISLNVEEVEGERTRLTSEFVAERGGFYYFALTSIDGFENQNPIRYQISLIQDTAPTVRIVKPGKNREVSARARFPIVMESEDDYGIESVELVFRTAARDEGDAQQELRMPIASVVRASKEASAEIELDLAKWGESPDGLPVIEGSRIEYVAEGRDALDQLGLSRTYVLTIVKEEDLTRIIQDELALIRERLEESLRLQKENRTELTNLQDNTRLAGDWAPKAPTEVSFARLKQEKINVRLEDNLERLEDVVDRVVANRLDGVVKDLPWIEGLKKSLSEIVLGNAPRALGTIDQLSRSLAAGGAKVEDLGPVLVQQRELEKALQELVQELGEWGDIRTMIRRFEELLRAQNDLEAKVRAKLKDE